MQNKTKSNERRVLEHILARLMLVKNVVSFNLII